MDDQSGFNHLHVIILNSQLVYSSGTAVCRVELLVSDFFRLLNEAFLIPFLALVFLKMFRID